MNIRAYSMATTVLRKARIVPIDPENPFRTTTNAPLHTGLPWDEAVKALDRLNGLSDEAPTRRGPGRPPAKWDEDKALEYLEALEEGSTISNAIAKCGLTRKTIASWLKRNPRFREQVFMARAAGAHTYADKVAELAEIAKNDPMADPQRIRVAMDGYKWMASKLMPGAYGDRLELTGELKTSGPDLSRLPMDDLLQMEAILRKHNLGLDFKPLDGNIIEGEATELPAHQGTP